MRHAVFGRRLGRTMEHRLALRRNMVQSLIEHGRIRTTLVKAKDIRPFAERVLQIAVAGAEAIKSDDRVRAVGLRQRAIAMLNDRAIIPKEHQEEYDGLSDAKRDKVIRARSGRRYRSNVTRPGLKWTAETVIHKLFSEVGPKLRDRNEQLGSSGGYLRIIKLADRRLGDGGQIAILELVGADDEPRTKNKAKTERRRKAAVRYAAYAGKPLPRRGQKRREDAAEAPAAVDEAAATEAPAKDAPAAESSEAEAAAAEPTEPQAGSQTPEAQSDDKPDEPKA